MTFFLSSENFTLGDHFAGGGLGLAIENQTSKYPFLAVEFDTFRNSWDPSSRQHVGIDINSVNSNITTDWSWSKGMEDGQKVNASITYDSTLKRLTVSFTAFSNNDELIEQNLIYDVDLRDYLPEWVNIGFSAATGSAFEQHNLYSWFFTSNLQEPKHIVPKDNTLQITDVPKNNTSTHRSNSNKVIGLAIGLSIGLCVFVGVIISSLSYFCCWKESKEEEGNEFIPNLSIDDEFGKNNGPRKFSYNDLVRATNNFSEQEKLGEGGFGAVYRGYLKEVDLFVAVKRISRESKQGIREYASEVKALSSRDAFWARRWFPGPGTKPCGPGAQSGQYLGRAWDVTNLVSEPSLVPMAGGGANLSEDAESLRGGVCQGLHLRRNPTSAKHKVEVLYIRSSRP
ncbi:hypothetical protein JCGZ_06948 [Jatropha curcas]|uniref:Legume lectin domain-containing protein n=1 Tax=Jatropha curcas TaxID=180498 RepID=A0A067KZC4_JATCU|nr:hypothetical protein JCGZ_06948 [Jatropha curcas]